MLPIAKLCDFWHGVRGDGATMRPSPSGHIFTLSEAAMPNRAATRMLVASVDSHPRILIAQSICNQRALSSATESYPCIDGITYVDYIAHLLISRI